jgi:hypothetical protein
VPSPKRPMSMNQSDGKDLTQTLLRSQKGLVFFLILKVVAQARQKQHGRMKKHSLWINPIKQSVSKCTLDHIEEVVWGFDLS